MTISLLAVVPNGYLSGAERVLFDRLCAARDRGWVVRCMHPADTPVATRLDELGVPGPAIAELRLPPGPRPVGAARLAGRWVGAARRLRAAAFDADVVVVNGITALPVVRLARIATPACWYVHDVVARRDYEQLVRFARPALDAALAVSSAAAALPTRLGVPTVVVPNGTPWPVETAAPDRSRRIIGVNGVLTAWKGHAVLLDAAARLPRDVTVELLGGTPPKDGANAEGLRRRAAADDLAGRVRFAGAVDDPVEHMRTWTVAVSPSVAPEAGSLAVLEAMSIGLPVVATNLGGSPELLGDAGILVRPSDAADLAAGIRRLLDDRPLAARLGAAARARVAARFTLSSSIEAFLAEVARLADSGPP